MMFFRVVGILILVGFWVFGLTGGFIEGETCTIGCRMMSFSISLILSIPVFGVLVFIEWWEE